MNIIEDPIYRWLSYVDHRGETRTIGQDEIAGIGGPVVVLGEPGQGKSILLETIAGQYNLTLVTAKQLLRRVPAPVTGSIVIDALDEVVTARESDALQRVLERLDAMGRPSFILSCRAADWQGIIASHDIATDYGRAPRLLTLLPFSRDEARTYLGAHVPNADSEKLLAHLEDRGLESLYGNPLTLRLLAEVATTALPENRGALFEAASNLLWREEAIQHENSPLGNLTQGEALDAAGAACALQILTGADAISTRAVGKVEANDRALRDVEILPMGGSARAVLGSRLFVRIADQRLAPLHRVLGEYLGARWLAALLTHKVSPRRLFTLLTLSDTVPASLRGLHAWIAYYSDEAASEVIRADPFGMLRYGDAGALKTPKARQLLEALEVLAADDPYFRAQDWGQLSLHGLARPDLQADFERILDDSNSFHLRKLLLEAVNGSPLAPLMERRLIALILNPEATFSERAEAAQALIGEIADTAWPEMLETLRCLADESSARLALETLGDLELAQFSDIQVVEIIAAYLGYTLVPIERAAQWTRQIGGTMSVFAERIPHERAASLLDLLVEYIPIKASKDEWERRWDLAQLAITLVKLVVADNSVAPSRLWSWLQLLDPSHGRSRNDYVMLEALFQGNSDLRRAIQRHVLLERSDKTLWERAWRLHETLVALGITPDDALAFLTEIGADRLRSAERDGQWMDLVQLARSRDGLSPEQRAIARIYAKGNSELLAHLRKAAKPTSNRWEKRSEQRRIKEERERQARFAEHRIQFADHIDELRAGELSWIVPAARSYLRLFHDSDRELPPVGRVEEWLGNTNAQAALEGFESTLHRSDLPTPEQVVTGFTERTVWNMVYPIIAGLAERVREHRGLDDVPRDTVRVGWLMLQHESYLPEHAKIDDFTEQLEKRLARDPAAFIDDFRLLIEPQLAAKADHVTGLYRLMRSPGLQPTGNALAAEWIERHNDLPRTIELELVDGLLAMRAFSQLRGLWRSRCPDPTDNPERALTWLAVAFITDFSAAELTLDEAAFVLPGLLWPIRGRLRRDERGERLLLTPEQLAWIVRTFRGRWPLTPHPSGVSSGDNNPWDATDFLQWAIAELAGDVSEKAMDCMIALRDAPRDTYSDTIRHAAAQQRRARNEANFSPVTAARVLAVAENKAPASIDDLLATLLDSLTGVESKLRGSETRPLAAFYALDGTPHDENYCRDRLVEWLDRELPPGVAQSTETRMPDDKRSDVAFTCGKLLVPLEIKAQWHPQVWDAAIEQLDRFYTGEWRAEGRGIYVVLWFGETAARRKRLTPAPNSLTPVRSADGLRRALERRIPEARRGQLAVVVIDLQR